MFYSQTFLARKGPLGTVWCAAHLQHRLKKSHYTSTNIPSTVDRIMFPEVPIALRMSGHLLLGVVRIYSKKVDYLYHDCNVILIGLRKAFSTVNVNLPEDATQAPAHTVTLPQKFDLDAVDLDDHILDDGYDNHRGSQEDITLTDQIPAGRDIYVAITFDEDIMMDSTCIAEVPDSGVRQMEEEPPAYTDVGFQEPERELHVSNQTEEVNMTADVQDPGASNQRALLTQTEVFQDPGASNQRELPSQTEEFQDPGASNQTEVLGGTLEFQEPGPSNQTEVLSPRPTYDTSPQNIPEIEVMRDASHDFSAGNLTSLFPDLGVDVTEPIGSSGQFLNEKETDTPTLEDLLACGGQSLQFQQHSEPPPSAFSQEAPEAFDTRISLGHSSPALAIRSTPPSQQPKRRKRKRYLFDKSVVLTNKFMKKALEDPSDLLRKKRNMPSSALGVWKFNNRARKEQIFHEPLLTGLCEDICNILKKDYISSKPQLATTEPMIADSPAPETEAVQEPSTVQSPTHAAETIPEPRAVQSPTQVTETIPEPSAVQSPTQVTETIPVLSTIQSPSHATETIPEPMIETIQEPMLAEPHVPEPEADMEIEQLRHDESNIGNDNFPEFMPSPARDVHSPFRRDDLTSFSPYSLGTTFGSAALPTPDVAASTGTHGSELGTPRTLSEERLGVQSTGPSSIPELINSAEAGDLSFLEAENSTPTEGSQASQGVESLSARTRAVAHYLKRQSPINPISEGPSENLSLNKILEGKTRKLCARMFFETLVLKSHGLIDVQQELPYGDISLKLTPALSKADI